MEYFFQFVVSFTDGGLQRWTAVPLVLHQQVHHDT